MSLVQSATDRKRVLENIDGQLNCWFCSFFIGMVDNKENILLALFSNREVMIVQMTSNWALWALVILCSHSRSVKEKKKRISSTD